MKRRKRKGEPAATGAGPASNESVPASMFVLASHCTAKDAVAMKASLCGIVAEMLPVAFDVGNVERIDAATMQLLCAFAKERRSRDLKIEWRGTSQVFEEAVRLLGVGALLGFAGVERPHDASVEVRAA